MTCIDGGGSIGTLLAIVVLPLEFILARVHRFLIWGDHTCWKFSQKHCGLDFRHAFSSFVHDAGWSTCSVMDSIVFIIKLRIIQEILFFVQLAHFVFLIPPLYDVERYSPQLRRICWYHLFRSRDLYSWLLWENSHKLHQYRILEYPFHQISEQVP